MSNKVFFDSAYVMKHVGDGERKALSKFGAFVRRTAKQSLKNATKTNPVSKPGNPPKMHVGTLKKRLYFAYDKQRGSVVIGPEKTQSGTTPETLEYGGVANITESEPKRITFKIGDYGCIRVRNASARNIKERFIWTKLETPEQVERATRIYIDNASNGNILATKKRVVIQPRPFMRPAFNKNLNNTKLRDCFKNSIK